MELEDWLPQAGFTFGSPGVCFYCGEPATSRDHVIPSCFISIGVRDYSRGIFTASCRDCNARLGAFMPQDLSAKVQRINLILTNKYRKLLGGESWTHAELCELRHSLRSFVRRRESLRRIVQRRVTWQLTTEFVVLWEQAYEKARVSHPHNRMLHQFMEYPWLKIPSLSPLQNVASVCPATLVPQKLSAAACT
jgi:hypothetical protein